MWSKECFFAKKLERVRETKRNVFFGCIGWRKWLNGIQDVVCCTSCASIHADDSSGSFGNAVKHVIDGAGRSFKDVFGTGKRMIVISVLCTKGFEERVMFRRRGCVYLEV
jgi:hypothetical protein